MDSKPSLTLYNPGLLSKSDLIRGFVARKPLLDKLLDDLRRTGIEGSPQHHLLLGQRGLGKTTLLRRLAFAIDDNPELAAIWQPLTFPEEQYNVTSLAEFWLNCADALSDALERSGRKAEAESLDQRVESMTGKDSAQALATLLEEAQRLNRKLVLLVDNIDIVLERIGKDQEWELRRNLTENSALTVIGGSSRALEAFYEHDRAFYDFFQVHELKGLDDDEAKALLNHLAEELNSEQVDRILKEQPARLRALRLLTGGNPRTLVLLFRVFEQGPEGDVQRDLEQLLDLYTPLYKARFEELPKQAQDVVDEIALNWDPVTAADVARLTGLHINVASSQLQRLLDLGVIEKVPWFGAKKTGFQIAERFFNIWYLMRASRRLRRKLVWLVKFLQAWFTEEELQDRARNLLDGGAQKLGSERYAELNFAYAQTTGDRRLRSRLEHAGLRAVMETDDAVRRMFDLSDLPKELLDKKQRMEKMRELGEAVVRARTDWAGIDPSEFWRLLGGSPYYDMAEKQRVVEGLKSITTGELVELKERLADTEFRVRRYFSWDHDLATVLYQTLQNGEMRDPFDWESAVAATGNGKLSYLAIACRLNSCIGLSDPEDVSEARTALEQMAEEKDLGGWAWIGLGNLLTRREAQYEEAEQAFRRAIEMDPANPWPWNNLGALLTQHLNRHDEAEQAYRRAIALDSSHVGHLANLGVLLTNHLNRPMEAEYAFRSAIEIDQTHPQLWNNLGHLLTHHLDRDEEAEQAFLLAVRLDSKYAKAFSNLGRLLRKKHQSEEGANMLIESLKLDQKQWWDESELIEIIQELSLNNELRTTAEQLAREAVATLPDSTSAKLLLAEVLTRAKNWAEARALAEPIFTHLATEADASITAFCAAAVATRKTPELLELFDQTGTNERWRPLYEALKAVQAGSKLYLRRVSPEVRHPAQRLLKEIAPNLGE